MMATEMDVLVQLGRESDDLAAQVLPFLEEADERAVLYMRQSFGQPSKTEKFIAVKNNDLIRLADSAPAAVQVNVFYAPDGPATLLTAAQYQVVNGAVQLMANNIELTPFGDLQATYPITYARVEVTYTPTSTVPSAVRNAVARLAAMLFSQRVQETGGITSERLGDYSYSRSADGVSKSGELPGAVKMSLRPFRRPLVRST